LFVHAVFPSCRCCRKHRGTNDEVTTPTQSSSLYSDVFESLPSWSTAHHPPQHNDRVDTEAGNSVQIAATNPSTTQLYYRIPVDGNCPPASIEYMNPNGVVVRENTIQPGVEATTRTTSAQHYKIPVDASTPASTDYQNLDGVVGCDNNSQPLVDTINPTTTAQYNGIPPVDLVISVANRTRASTDNLNLDGVVIIGSSDYENLTERPSSTTNNVYEQLQSVV